VTIVFSNKWIPHHQLGIPKTTRMNSISLLVILALCAQTFATFSIVAVDTVTREVGGAGASCINNSRIINDLIIGVGALHTQALYIRGNQNYAHELMFAGFAPDDIVDSLIAHDFSGNPEVRQYGIVDLTRQGASAAFTGDNCTDWAGHRTGPTYSIQGNILLSEHIVDTMEYAFTHTTGRLDEKLMAALEAAKIPGADTRCLPNKSAISAFIRVARITDNIINPYLDLDVPSTSDAVDPIDVLRDDYDQWFVDISTSADPINSSITPIRFQLNTGGDTTTVVIELRNNRNEPLPPETELTAWTSAFADVTQPVWIGNGTWTCVLTSLASPQTDTIYVFSFAGIRPIELRGPTIDYQPLAVNPDPITPGEFTLRAYPNPFNSEITISFSVPFPAHATVQIYNLQGREVAQLIDENIQRDRLLPWNATNNPTGLYFIHATSNQSSTITKVFLLK
jgi:uncharacterized Ntn-hydrolase superfamily protein